MGESCWTVRVPSLAGLLVVVALTAGGCASTPGETELQGRVQRAVDGILATRDIPGASVAVIDAGRLVVAVSGYADLERRQPIGAEDEFRVASIAKTYLAARWLDLDSEGVMRLDEPVGRWLPHLPSRLAFLRTVTMRQLLSHTSGLAQTVTDDRDRGTRSKDPRREVSRDGCDGRAVDVRVARSGLPRRASMVRALPRWCGSWCADQRANGCERSSSEPSL